MASEEEVNRSKELKNNLEEILFLQRSFTDEAKNLAKAFFDSNTQAAQTSRAFREIAKSSRDLNTELEDIIAGEMSIEDIGKKLLMQKKSEKTFVKKWNQRAVMTKMSQPVCCRVIWHVNK